MLQKIISYIFSYDHLELEFGAHILCTCSTYHSYLLVEYELQTPTLSGRMMIFITCGKKQILSIKEKYGYMDLWDLKLT